MSSSFSHYGDRRDLIVNVINSMQPAFHITTKVLSGNRIEIQLPSGSEGEEVDVFIVLAAKQPIPGSQNWMDGLSIE
jgi:hypothetical protein